MSITSGDGLSLVYGDTTLTPMGTDTLAIKADTLQGGEVYSFRLKVTNSLGAWSSATLNVTAGRSPWGGVDRRLAQKRDGADDQVHS